MRGTRAVRESGSARFVCVLEAARFTTENTESTEEAMEKDPFTSRVIGCAIEVHRILGPGRWTRAFVGVRGQPLT